jgi:hypothetical protein
MFDSLEGTVKCRAVDTAFHYLSDATRYVDETFGADYCKRKRSGR